MREWRPIIDFPDYSVSNHGDIRNDTTDRLLRVQTNTTGVCIVGLRRDNRAFKRSVPLIVATAFKPNPGPLFTTPINLDGDKRNNHFGNLAWRPRWFAYDYTTQFNRKPLVHRFPIEEMDTGEIFYSVRDVAITFGLLEEHIIHAAPTHRPVFPTNQRFRFVFTEEKDIA